VSKAASRKRTICKGCGVWQACGRVHSLSAHDTSIADLKDGLLYGAN
jgi:hypothetical protein